MKTTLVTPKSPLLRKFIQYFSFVENRDDEYSKSSTCYPNTNFCLGIYKGSTVVESSDHHFQVLPYNNFNSYLSGIYQKPMNVHYMGAFRGLWLNFEPLGLEMLSGKKVSEDLFIHNAIETLLPKNWSKLYELAFSNKNPHSCAKMIEKFFLSNMPLNNKIEYVPFNKIQAKNIDDLKDVYYKSYSSINRIYKNSLDISPKEFLNVLRFRKSVEQIHSTSKLTDIGYKEGYSDQSHMIREFKKYTSLTPKNFRQQSRVIQKQLCLTLA